MKELTTLLDADDILLRTGEKKVEWLRKHLTDEDLVDKTRTIQSIQPYECSLSALVPIIGQEVYTEMTSFVYSLEGTIPILQLEGALCGVQELSKLGDIYVVSARKPEQTKNTAEWCKRNNFFEYFIDIFSTEDPKYSHIEKVAIARMITIGTKYAETESANL